MSRIFEVEQPAATGLNLNLEQDLNAAQRAAVLAGPGPKLVIAGAGSGKTRTITYRVAHLIGQGVAPSDILLVTFTNKAAKEMLNRVESLVGPVASQVWGGTFHSIGNRLLRKYADRVGLKPNYSILDTEDQRSLVKICIADAKIKTEEKRFPTPRVVQDLLSYAFSTERALSSVIEERAPHFIQWTEDLQRIGIRYMTKKKESNAVDYDDLLRYWLQLIQEHPDVTKQLGEQFKYILVDEYQDTSINQAKIVEMIAAQNGRNLMVVGDDAQSIYKFRGAHYDNILDFPKRNEGTEVFKLEENYRSTPEILNFTNASIGNNNHQFDKTLVSMRDKGCLPVIVPVNDLYQEAGFVATRIQQLLDEGVRLKEMAVLYRAHMHSSILQAELIKRGLRYEIRSGVRFFEQAHIKDVVAHLKVLENPFDEMAWRRLLLMLPRVGNATVTKIWNAVNQSADPLNTFLQEPTSRLVPAGAKDAFVRFQKDLQMLLSLKDRDDTPGLIQAVLDTNYVEFMRATYTGIQNRTEDVQQLALFARSYPTLSEFLTEMILLGEMYGQDVDSSDDDQVVLSSIHQAKGLEWKVVFIIRMCEGEFPSERALGEHEGEEEERRIFYVAATRAEDELYITHPMVDMGFRGGGQMMQPSRFIREVRFTLYEQGEVRSTPQYRY